MMKRIGHDTIDEVNEDTLARLGEASNVSVEPVTSRDPPPNGEFDALLYDLDCMPPDQRKNIVSGLLTNPPKGAVGVHSYNLDEREVAALERNGVKVFRSLGPNTISELLAGPNGPIALAG